MPGSISVSKLCTPSEKRFAPPSKHASILSGPKFDRRPSTVIDLVEKVDADAVKTITEAGGHVSEPSPELHKFMQDAGKRSWKLFYDTVPNAKEILDSADSYRQAK